MDQSNRRDYHFLDLSEIPFAHKRIIRNESGEMVDYVFLYANPALENMLGISQAQLIGRLETDVFGLDKATFAKKIQDIFRQFLKSSKGETSFYSGMLLKWYRIQMKADVEDTVLVSFQDITPERVLLQNSDDIFKQRLPDTSLMLKRFFQIANASFVYYWQYEPDKHGEMTGKAFFNSAQFKPLEVIFETCERPSADVMCHHSEEDYRSLRQFETIEPGFSHQTEWERLIQSNPSLCFKLYPVRSGEQLLGVFLSIKEPNKIIYDTIYVDTFIKQLGIAFFAQKKEREKKLAIKNMQASEAKFNSLFDNVLDSIFAHTIREDGMPGNFIFANKAACERLGYTKEEFLQMTPEDLDTKEKFANVPNVMAELLETGQVQFETVHVAKDGRMIPLEMSSHIFMLDNQRTVIVIARDISERIMAFNREKRDRQLLQSILDTLPGSVVVINRDYEITAINLKTRHKINDLNVDNQHMLNQKCYTVFEGRETVCDRCNFEKLIQEKKPFSEILEIKGPDGVKTYSQRYYAPLMDETGKITNLIEYVEDITELVKSKKTAEKANRTKTEFLMNMSHELRTPLNGILGFSNILEKTPLSEEQVEYIKNVKYSGQHLLSIINDILDFSKIETNKLTLRKEKTNIRNLLKYAMALIKQTAYEKQLKTQLVLDDKLPECVFTDQLRLNQVIANLLYNAVKFTNEGSITLSADIVDSSDHQVTIQFSVKDTGIGIDASKKEDIFKSFTQVDSSLTRQFGGTGLGLTISNSILKLMGSEMNMISNVGKGSTFSFTLTFERDIPITWQFFEKNESDTLQEESATILIAEDDALNLKLNRTILENKFPNVKIIIAENGLECIEKHKTGKPDIILMDVRMPGIDGITATERIREQDSTVKIIGLSAEAREGWIKRGLEAGMNDYLTKPLVHHELLDILKKYL